MRIKALVMLSVVTGAFSIVGGATPAHACTSELPSTACVVHDLCMVLPKFC